MVCYVIIHEGADKEVAVIVTILHMGNALDQPGH